MPFIGEQPKLAGDFTVTGRSSNTIIEVAIAAFTVTTRTGTVSIGVA